MPDDKRDLKSQDQKSKNIRVAISDPSLAEKLRIRLPDFADDICWYIKFNIALDPLSVSDKSMTVTEANGYILETDISYDTERNLIVICPADPYEEGISYILTITRKVRSKSGSHLKRTIYVLFKIKDHRIEEYKLLPSDTVVKPPRKKPEKLKAETAARVYAFSPQVRAKVEKTPAHSLPYGKLGVNFLLALIGIPVSLIGLISRTQAVVLAGTLLLCLGLLHMIIQLANKKKRAAIAYNIGTMFFNAGFYKAAAKAFNKAFNLDQSNELAEMAVNKSKFYK